MKALETEYNGILFRSRLEARWAIFFDALKVDYVYEPECFVLENNKKYTPDFYIPKYDFYIEIKPNLDYMKSNYNIERYKEFDKMLLIIPFSYPGAITGEVYNFYENENERIIFCPNRKYAPFFMSGDSIGEESNLFDYSKELEIVKAHRFWK